MKFATLFFVQRKSIGGVKVRKKSYLIKPLLESEYITATHGKGVYLYDDQGNEYLDGSSGAVTASIGHAVPEIIAAMHEQAQKVSFVYRSQFTTVAAENLAEKLNELIFSKDNSYYSFFVNSGSEATETAMKIAIQYWQEQGNHTKKRVISRWTSYHGITMGALSLSGHSQRRKRFVSLLEDAPVLDAPNCYRCPFDAHYPACQLKCATALEGLILKMGAENIAAFIAEPIVGAAGGVIVPPEGYYEKIKEICDRYQVLFIADEVMTGIGRTGKLFAMEHWDVRPDIIALGKGMSAGYTPIAATLVSDKVMAPIVQGSKAIMSGHTFSANPQSAAVALAVLNYVEENHLVKKAEEKGVFLLEQLTNLKEKYRIIGEVRGKGLMIGIEFVADQQSKTPFSQQIGLTNTLILKAREKGLLIYPAAAGIEGGPGDAIIISPPLTINKQEMEQLVERLSAAIAEVESELKK